MEDFGYRNYISDATKPLAAGLYKNLHKQYEMKDYPLLDMKIPCSKGVWEKPYLVVYKDVDGVIKTAFTWGKTLAFIHYQDFDIKVPIHYSSLRNKVIYDERPVKTILYMFKITMTNMYNHYKRYPNDKS